MLYYAVLPTFSKTMNKLIAIFLSLALGMMAFGQSAETRAQFYGQEPPKPEVRIPELPAFSPDFGLNLAWHSRNMKEGWTRCDGPTGALQAEFSESGAYLGFWGAYDFTDRVNRKWRFQETRLYAGFAMNFINAGKFGPVTIDLSWTYNHYLDHSRDDAPELSLAFALDQLYHRGRWQAAASLTLNHNYDDEESWLDFATRLTCLLDEAGRKSIVTSFHLYWGDSRKVRTITSRQGIGNAFYAAVLQTEYEWYFTDHLALSPYIALASAPDRRARHAAKASPRDASATVWAGLRLTWQF